MISMIVLAAGKSTRMQGINKLLADVRGVPMVRRVVEASLGAKVDEVIVVVGWEQELVRSVLNGLQCRIIVNGNYENGQSSSVRTGLAEVSPSARAVLILPGDVAMVDSKSIEMVVEAYGRGKHVIVVAAHRGESGHPILFDRRLFPEVARINEETFGLKAVVYKHRSEVHLVEAGSQAVLKDIDTPQDLNQVTQRMADP